MVRVNKDDMTLKQFKETADIAESLDRINLTGHRMRLYEDMTRKLQEMFAKRYEYNTNQYIAEKKRIVDVYLSKVKDIDYQLNKHGINANHAKRPYTQAERASWDKSKAKID
jgi:hypothetical protein